MAHIEAELIYIIGVTQDIDFETFLEDPTLKRAIERSLSIVGEAVKRLPEAFRLAHPDTDWRAIAGTRDKLIHDYLGIDYELVWDIVANKVPDLYIQIKLLRHVDASDTL